MAETIEQGPTRREVLPYKGIRALTQPLCPEFWISSTDQSSDLLEYVIEMPCDQGLFVVIYRRKSHKIW
jgi:hypothetical protein